MKVDYELVEKIGATHYNTSNGSLYKVKSPYLLMYIKGNWERSGLSKADIVSLLKPIPPKPQVRVAYERAKYSKISDAISAHESGVKFKRELPDGDFTNYLSWFELCECYANNYKIVVEIEKPVDWKDELKALGYFVEYEIADGSGEFRIDEDDFLYTARLALKANGEL